MTLWLEAVHGAQIDPSKQLSILELTLRLGWYSIKVLWTMSSYSSLWPSHSVRVSTSFDRTVYLQQSEALFFRYLHSTCALACHSTSAPPSFLKSHTCASLHSAHMQDKMEEVKQHWEQREQDAESWTSYKEQVMFMGGMQGSSHFMAWVLFLEPYFFFLW